MADTNHIRRDDYIEFSENDPFAELTRIMGHDPRVQDEPQQPVAPEAARRIEPEAPGIAADDFVFDLEKELAGDFDFSDFDEQPATADWRENAVEATLPAASEEVAAASLDDDFDVFFTDAAAHEADAQETAVPAALDEDLDSVLERELFSGAQQPSAPEFDAFQATMAEPAAEWTGDLSPADEPSYQPLHREAADFDAPAAVEAEDGWAAEAEFDLDFLESELAASAAQSDATPPSQPVVSDAPVPAAEADEGGSFDETPQAPVPVAAAAPSLSLEEELSLLLAEDPAPAAEQEALAPVGAYGRANFAAGHSAAPADAPREEFREAVAAPAPVPEETHSWQGTAREEAQPRQEAADELSDLFDDDFDFSLDDEAEASRPATAAAIAALPEIETVDVAEAVEPVADDLDIPDIDYGAAETSAPAPFDDFEAEFADVFGDPVKDEPVSAAASAAAPTPPAYAYELDDAQWQDAQAFPDGDFNYRSDLEQAMSMSAYEDEEPRPAPRRRGLLVAAVVAGVAVLGGVAVFGMSMFGGGSDTPALVRADPEPMKVRPENPGGTTVPNQDNEVYQRVSGGASDAPPAQERLITATEEPVDMAARTVAPQEPALLAPGIDDEAVAGQPKSEDRIEPDAQAGSPVSAEETAVIAPRRVRTMVVRPDGTMVPREEIAPAAVEQPVAGDQPAIAAPPVLAQPIEQAQGVPVTEPVSEIDEGPTIDMPQTVAVVPTQRTEPQAAVAPARPAAPAAQPAVQQPARQPAAPAPVADAPGAAAPAAAAAGEWSMQIASQPTAEGAQSTYQDLARRYSGVLQGRGVNIVRADIEGRGTYYRVRIPASSRDEAIQLCTRYKAAGGSCFVSR